MEIKSIISQQEDIIIKDLLESTGRISSKMLAEALQHHQKSLEEGSSCGFREILVQEGFLKEEELTQMIPGYTLLSRIGEGKSGLVYKARQHSLDRVVAMKILNPRLSEKEPSLEKFLREAYTLGKLEHPNIVHAYDFGKYGSIHYIVMEYFEGITLGEYMKGKMALEEKEALFIASKIFCALRYLWNKKMIHRDINPDNVMIRGDMVKVCDLGLVRCVFPLGEQTTFRLPVKNYAFLSPEQGKGEPLDFLSDLYSFGAILYFMLTGNCHISPSSMGQSGFLSSPSYPPRLSNQTKILLGQILQEKPEDRISDCDEIEKMLCPVFDSKVDTELAIALSEGPGQKKFSATQKTLFGFFFLALNALLLCIFLFAFIEKTQPAPPHFSWNAAEVYAHCVEGVVLIQVESKTDEKLSSIVGSGVILSYQKKRIILTNAHVVEEALTVAVSLRDGRSFEAQVFQVDKVNDLALLQIPSEIENLTTIVLAEDSNMQVGEDVFVIGHPKGYYWSLSCGTLSGIRGDRIQTDAAINPGNSGGPILNSQGKMIALTTSILGNSNAISLAISTEKIKKFLHLVFSTHKKL